MFGKKKFSFFFEMQLHNLKNYKLLIGLKLFRLKFEFMFFGGIYKLLKFKKLFLKFISYIKYSNRIISNTNRQVKQAK